MARIRNSAVLTLTVVIGAAALVGASDAGERSATPWADSSIGWQPTLLVQIAVSDLDQSIAFYRDTMDFDLELRDDDLQWARMKCGISGVTIGLGVQPTVAGSGTVSMNFGVGNIERARKILESRGVVFDGETINIPGVVQLADLQDPDGNKIRLAGHSN